MAQEREARTRREIGPEDPSAPEPEERGRVDRRRETERRWPWRRQTPQQQQRQLHSSAHFASVCSCGHSGATTSTFIPIQTHILPLSHRVVTEVQRHLHSSAFKRTFCLCLFLWIEEQRQLHSFICTQTHILRLFLWIEEEQLSYIHPHTKGHEEESISLFFAFMITFFCCGEFEFT
jgi:hypothetical protein